MKTSTTITPNERLKRYLEESGLTQKEAAAQAIISERMMGFLVRGEKKITARMRKKLCSALNLSEAWLSTGRGEELGDMVRENWALEQMALSVLAGRQVAY